MKLTSWESSRVRGLYEDMVQRGLTEERSSFDPNASYEWVLDHYQELSGVFHNPTLANGCKVSSSDPELAKFVIYWEDIADGLRDLMKRDRLGEGLRV